MNYKIHKQNSLKIDWSRDVFDRMLTAEASATESKLITADEPIQANFKQAIWQIDFPYLNSEL